MNVSSFRSCPPLLLGYRVDREAFEGASDSGGKHVGLHPLDRRGLWDMPLPSKVDNGLMYFPVLLRLCVDLDGFGVSSERSRVRTCRAPPRRKAFSEATKFRSGVLVLGRVDEGARATAARS